MDIKDSYLHGTKGVVKSISVTADKLTYNLADINNTSKTITLPVATSTDNGLLSSEDKKKLDQSMTITQAIPYIKGPDTDTTAGTWTGSYSGITEYTEGLTIIYVPKVAGASTTTLNINNLGAKTCYYTGSSKLTTHYAVGTPILLTYSNEGWRRVEYSQWTPYVAAYCSTAAATSAKVATCSSYTLTAKSYVHILLVYANTAQKELTLNINSKGAKPIYINGEISSASNYTLPAGTYIAYYDGTNFYFRTDGVLPGTIQAAGSADKVNNNLAIKIKSGTIEGTDLYTYNGSQNKTLDIKQGSNITLTTSSETLTIAASDTKVTQTNTTTSSAYRVLFSGNANDTTETTTVRKSTNLTFNPSTGTLNIPISNITNQLVIANTNNAKHILFSRGSSSSHPYNYIAAPEGGIISILPNGVSNSSSSGIQFTSVGIQPATSQAYSLGTSSNKWNIVYATTLYGNLDGTHVNKLTGYIKSTSASNIAATDTLNAALGKLEYKAHYAYDWIIGVTATDTDEYINKWSEIVGFLDSVKEDTDILDEFVTRKTAQTITGEKTFSGTTATLLTINRNSTNPAWIRFMKNNSLLGYFGIDNSSNPLFLSGVSGSTNQILLHSGNYTAYVNTTNFPGLNSTGTVTSIKVGSTSYSPSSGVVSLPAYPTALKNPHTLTFAAGTFSAKTYDGSTAVTVNVPTHTSHLTNNSGFLTDRGYIGTTQVQASSASQHLTGIGNLTMSGNLSLYTASGDSPAIVFQRGTIGTDAVVDWRMYVTSGHLKIQSALSSTNNGAWTDVLKFDTYTNKLLTSSYHILPLATNTLTLGTSALKWANVYATTFTGNLTGNVTGNVSGSSGSCTGNSATATKLKTTTITSSVEFQLSNTAWLDTGYTFTNLATGTYAIQVTSGTNLVASGIMSVYKNLEDTAGDEIPLHVYGTAGWRPYLRTYNNKLQISSNDISNTSRTVTIKIAQIL